MTTRGAVIASLLSLPLLTGYSSDLKAQLSNMPTTLCHMTDGIFGSCPGGQNEWADVKPLSFPASDSFLYVNQDAEHSFLYLMYDFPIRTTQLGATESVHVNFDTVEQASTGPVLIEYDVLIQGNGQVQILQQGKPTPPGRIVAAQGFGRSPNSTTPHLMAELQVPLSAGPPSTYSPDPLFWNSTIPPTPPPPPPPPSCPVMVLGVCVKSQSQIDAWQQEADADNAQGQMIFATETQACNQPVVAATMVLDEQTENLKEALTALQGVIAAAASRGEISGAQEANVESAILQTDEAAGGLLEAVQTGGEIGIGDGVGAIATLLSGFTDAAIVTAVAAIATDAAIVTAQVALITAGAIAITYAACQAAAAASAGVYFIAAQGYLALATDPPDTNFTVVATPVVPSVPIQPITTATGLSSQLANDLNSSLLNSEQEISLLQVILVSMNREAGAVAAGNSVWQAQQAQAVRRYTSQLIPLVQNEASLNAALTKDFEASGLIFSFSANDISSAFASLQQTGLPPSISAALTQLGADATTQAAILQAQIATSPTIAGLLGVGAFPRSLSDPSSTSAANAAVNALNALAATPPATSLSQSFSFVIPGDYTAKGVGLRGNSEGSIVISAVPAGATVQKAFLYWGMLDNGEDPTLKQLTFDNNPIEGTRIGSGPDTCWGRTNSFTYRADVTPFVTGNGTYRLANVAAGGSVLAEGASLVVIYQLEGAPVKTIMLDDGNLTIPSGTSTGTAAFGAFTTTSPVAAMTSFIVGDGQAAQFNSRTPTSFTGSAGTINFPNLFNSLDGPLWDTSTFDVSAAVGTNSSSGLAKISVSGDCLLWSAQAFSVTSTLTATPVIATAAVVQASTNGDTVIEGRGLTSADIPTIQDEIAMIVQFRMIHNPATSGADLTAQLVQGLVNDGVIAVGQASDIQKAVTASLVTPIGSPTISGKVLSRQIVSPGVLQISLQLTNTGSGVAKNIIVNRVALKSLGGTGAPLLDVQSRTLPLVIGDLTVGATATVDVFVDIPSTVSRFSVTESGRVNDAALRSFTFSTNQIVFNK